MLFGYVVTSRIRLKQSMAVTYKNWFIMQESYGTTRGYKGYLFVPYEAFTEKWTGLYSVDTYIKSLHAFELDSNLIKYAHFHDKNRVDFPCTTIELKVGSKNVQVNKVEQVMDYPATVEQGTTLVPFRFLCEDTWIYGTLFKFR